MEMVSSVAFTHAWRRCIRCDLWTDGRLTSRAGSCDGYARERARVDWSPELVAACRPHGHAHFQGETRPNTTRRQLSWSRKLKELLAGCVYTHVIASGGRDASHLDRLPLTSMIVASAAWPRPVFPRRRLHRITATSLESSWSIIPPSPSMQAGRVIKPLRTPTNRRPRPNYVFYQTGAFRRTQRCVQS